MNDREKLNNEDKMIERILISTEEYEENNKKYVKRTYDIIYDSGKTVRNTEIDELD